MEMKFDAKTIAAVVTMIVLLITLLITTMTGVGKLFVMDYRIGLLEQNMTELNANVRLILGRAVYDWTVPLDKEKS